MHNHGKPNNSKPKDLKGTLIKLIKYSKSFAPLFILAIILAFLSSIIQIIGPDKIKDITNIITQNLMVGIPFAEVRKIAIFLAIIYVLGFIFNYIQGYIMAYITNIISRNYRNDIAIKINKLPLAYFDRSETGDILSRVTNDVDTICHTLSDSVGVLVGSGTLFIGTTIMMFYTNWIMALTAIVSSIIGFIGMILIVSLSQKYFDGMQKGLGDINGHIEEVYSGHNVVKAYNGEEEVLKEFDEINEKLYKDSKKGYFYSGLMGPLMGFIGNFGYVCVCIVGAVLTSKNYIDFGVIVAFMIYIRLFSNPLSQLAQVANQVQMMAAAGERVFEFLEEQELSNEEAITKELIPSKVKGNIKFDHVKFGYNDDKLIIKDFSADIKKGQKIAIVGPTGAGKTTLVNLLMRFYEINQGSISIDGVNIKDITRENIHKLFIMVLQDTWTFDGTINENIKYNKYHVTDEDVVNACKTVGLHHFIKTLPNGYDTKLGDVDSLSAGQKQLLTIARGMIEDAPFLILDEATSNVDTRTESLVQKAMDKLTKGRTSFIIAHRLSTIKNADLILVLDEGNIVEMGNHEELLKLNGFYANLYNSQFQSID
ncbi:MAG: ABC transporter ATP-binding protein [Bacilli bacterium]|nr:ABC transporter ATP-binding protein [Bacilli bacterium]